MKKLNISFLVITVLLFLFFIELSSPLTEGNDADGQSAIYYGLQYFMLIGVIILGAFYLLILILLMALRKAFRNKFFIFNMVLQVISLVVMTLSWRLEYTLD